MNRILVADDDAYVYKLFRAMLDNRLYEIEWAEDGRACLERASRTEFDIIFLDLRMPVLDGIATLRALRERGIRSPVVTMTAFGSIDKAVEVMKLGSEEFLTKPFESVERLQLVIDRILQTRDLRRENEELKDRLLGGLAGSEIIGISAPMREMLRLVEKVAGIDSTVLITGESGTGKELVARTLHRQSPRRAARFIPVNCGGIPETLLESSLFGHEKGAFTGAHRTSQGYFEVAQGGTIFLDEIASTSPGMQVRLLRVLEDRTFNRVGGTAELQVDVRVIAATNTALEDLVAAGRFREDLFYRLNVITVRVPPLRERVEDIEVLARHFLARYGAKFGRSVIGFSPEVIERYRAMEWKGNVRELENAVERAVALADGGTIGLAQAGLDRPAPPPTAAPVPTGAPAPSAGDGFPGYEEAKLRFHREYFSRLLAEANDNIALAARISGIPRQNLYRKLAQAGIRRG